LYCFNFHKLDLSSSHLEIEILEKILKSEATHKVKNWFLSGGEPLCYPYLDEALELFRSYGHRPKMATNGIGLRPDVVDKWVSLGVQSVQFSIDSLKPSVFSRLNRGSEKNHRAIIENLSYAVQSPLRVVTSSVLTTENVEDVYDVMKFSHDMGCDSYTLYPNVPAEKRNQDLIIPISEQTGVIDSLIAGYGSLSSTLIIDLSIPCFQFSDTYAKWKDTMDIRLHACGAGQYNLRITSEGRVSACICQDAEDFIVGDLHSQDIDEIWNSVEIANFRTLYKDIPECRVCDFQAECRGGCRNEAYVFGDQGILSGDPHCAFFRGQGS
jgi:radical SAM protein with 4Fe4S-binding SPASM domain